MTNNMELWEKVCKTNVDYTKEVNVGRKFTAIDAHYQVMRATEVLGRAGEGWGFECVDKTFLPTDQVALTVRVWTGKRENYIEHIGQCGLYIDKKKTMTDGDCVKKAMTDGLTKCLSYFGFSADVFLGKFEDNKYVAELKEEFKEKPNPRIDELYNEHNNKLMGFEKTEGDKFKVWWASKVDERLELKELDTQKFVNLLANMKTKCKEFAPTKSE